MIKMKRAYEVPEKSDGFRVLVDRLWPRGVSKEKAAVDLWLKDVAPSNELRKWFGHDPAKWPEFGRKYAAELKDNPEAVNTLRGLAKEHKTLTLVYAAKDEEHNEAAYLKGVLE